MALFAGSASSLRQLGCQVRVAAVCGVLTSPEPAADVASAPGGRLRTIMRALAEDHDVVLVHDPELLLAAAGLRIKNLIWDVHEDPAAALQVKAWMPAVLRRPARRGAGPSGSRKTAFPVVGRTRLSAEVPPTASCGGKFCIGPQGGRASWR